MVVVHVRGKSWYILDYFFSGFPVVSAFPPCDVALNVALTTKSISLAMSDILAAHEAIHVLCVASSPSIFDIIVATKWWLGYR